MGARIVALALTGLALGAAACSGNDTAAPGSSSSLQSVSPAAGSTGVSPTTVLTIRFTGPIASGMEQYVDLHRGGLDGALVPMSCSWSADRATLTCTPGTPLEPGAGYTIHMGTGMLDADGQMVEVERPGMQMGGEAVTGQMMGGMHGGQQVGLMGPGWRHAGDGHLGMTFSFTTG